MFPISKLFLYPAAKTSSLTKVHLLVLFHRRLILIGRILTKTGFAVTGEIKSIATLTLKGIENPLTILNVKFENYPIFINDI